MKKILLFPLIIFTLNAHSQVKLEEIQFDKELINFGTIPGEGGTVEAVYTLYNRSNKVFMITGIDVACGCTKPKSDKDEVKPGDSAKISAQFNPAGMVGTVSKWIRVEGNFVDGLYKELKFSAEITNKAYTPENSAQKYIPGQFGYLLMGKLHVDFGNRLQYFHARDSIMVYNDGYRVIIIKEVVGLPEYLHVPQLPLTIEPKQGLQLYIDVKSETLDTVGPVSGSFRFITTDQFFPEKTVTFYMNLAIDFDSWKRRDLKKAAVFTTESTTVDMGQMKGGAVKTKTIEISNTGKSPLIIYRVESDCSCTLLEEAVRVIQPGEVVTLVIKFDSLYKHGKQSKAVKVYTNDPNMPIVIFTVSAVVN